MAFIHWFYANVLGNLVASAFWSLPTTYLGLRKLYKQQHQHHQEMLRAVHLSRQRPLVDTRLSTMVQSTQLPVEETQ